MIYKTPFSLLYGKRRNKKKTIGKFGQKEHLVFHVQLNWYIFYTFHNKNRFHIISCNISSYVHKNHFLFHQKEEV